MDDPVPVTVSSRMDGAGSVDSFGNAGVGPFFLEAKQPVVFLQKKTIVLILNGFYST